MSSYSPNSIPPTSGPTASNQSWSQWSSIQYKNETAVLKSHIPLVIATSMTTAI